MQAHNPVKEATAALESMRAIAMNNGWWVAATKIEKTIQQIMRETF